MWAGLRLKGVGLSGAGRRRLGSLDEMTPGVLSSLDDLCRRRGGSSVWGDAGFRGDEGKTLATGDNLGVFLDGSKGETDFGDAFVFVDGDGFLGLRLVKVALLVMFSRGFVAIELSEDFLVAA